MIIRPEGDNLILIRQPDHAALSGEMAARWGNDRFARPEPHDEVTLGVYEHDHGWAEWDARPRIDTESGRPYAFTNMPVDEYLEIWERGITRMRERNHYAGLLVGRHGVRLVRRRLGRTADPPDVLAKMARFVAETEAHEQALKAEWAGTAGWKETDEARLEANYALLRTCDTLSLLLCCGPLAPSAIDDAPAQDSAERVRLRLTPQDERTLICDPYPFAPRSFHLAVAGRRVPRGPYRSHEDLWATLAAGETVTLEFTLRAPAPPMP